MLARMGLVAGALLLATPAMADDTCLPAANGAQCDIFAEQYRSDDVPVGTINAWSKRPFVVERLGSYMTDAPGEARGSEDVLYWDGDSAMIVSEETGPRLEIADW